MPHVFPFDQAKADQLAPAEAVRLLSALRLPGESVMLQTFADGPEELYSTRAYTRRDGEPGQAQEFYLQAGRGRPWLPTVKQGSYTLDQLAEGPFKSHNLARCGVFFAVNVFAPETERRRTDAVQRVAAVFLDLDGAPLPEAFPLAPTSIVESSTGKYHVYWAVQDLPLGEFTNVQRHLAGLYGGDPKVCDLPRVMRLPGYWHGKKEQGFLTRILALDPEAQYSRADLLSAFPGLEEALTEVERARAGQLQRAAALRAELSSGAVTGQAEAQRKHAQVALIEETASVSNAGGGGRNDALNRAAYSLGQLVGAGTLDEVEAAQELEAAAQSAGLPDHETRRTIQSGMGAGKQKPRDLGNVGAQVKTRTQTERLEPAPTPQQPQGYKLPTFPLGTQEGTDEANAVILAANGLGHRLRYTSGLGWMVYSAGVWTPSRDMVAATQVAGEVLREVVGQYLADAIRQRVDSEERARIGRWANAVCQNRIISSALAASAGKPEFYTDVRAWDAHPHMFNCLNGVLNLHTGELLPHDPALLLTWKSGAAYDPSARHPNVDKLLGLLEADGRADFLQRSAGSALYGLAPNETLTVFQGEGGTGKGTLVSAVVAMLGDYATTLDVELLLDQRSGGNGTGPKPELLNLRGKRLAVAGEPQKGRRFNAGRVKGMTGNDPITARAMHSDVIVEFAPVFKLWVHTNYPIASAHDDTGMQRRIRVVPFSAKPPKADPQFKRRLEGDPHARSALLNWAYQGFRAWWGEGYELGESEAVERATRGYISEQNPYERFAADCLSFGPGLSMPSKQLEDLFKEWCDENAVRHGVKVAELRNYLQQQGCERGRATGGGRKWLGVGISDTGDSSDTDLQGSPHTRIGLVKNSETAVTPVTAVTHSEDLGNEGVAGVAQVAAVSYLSSNSPHTREGNLESGATPATYATRDDVQPVAAGWEGEEI